MLPDDGELAVSELPNRFVGRRVGLSVGHFVHHLPPPLQQCRGPTIPAQVQPAYDAIVALTDAFCQVSLTPEYQDMCRHLTRVLATKSPSPLLRGKAEVWAAGILRVIGRVNFLDLDTGMEPFLRLATIDKRLGVSSATSQSKAKAIRDLLNIQSFDLDWMLPSLRNRGIRRRLLTFSPECFDVLDREFLRQRL